jgi:3-hydroxy-5-methyl-1-naphthoate 3-O-methyltransferase
VNAIGTNGIRRMLGVGGGSGAYSIAFAQAIPDLHAEILDLEGVVSLTRENVRQAGLAGRTTVRAADVLHDPLGENYDLILVSQICHAFSPDRNRELFARAYSALAANGRIAMKDFILETDKTAPRAAALFSLNMLAGSRAGSNYSEAEYAHWLRAAGFTDIPRLQPAA